MGKIQLMSAALANQIAAGEVVVRPASCVKELVENSLDAGAKQITVTLKEGGISQIIVQDDGVGMSEEDAQMAFLRHATSKVYDERDLLRIRTLGFRGEALASIGAVAKVVLTTRTEDSEYASQVSIEGGDMGPLRHVGQSVGTRIEVKDLFFNTPARLKYMRTLQTEQAKSVEVVQKAALSRPDVSFCCQTEHQVLFQTQGNGDVRAVLAALYGVGEAKQMLSVSKVSADYELTGFIGRPTQGRSSRAYAHLFINGRPIRNIAVHQAVIQGYQNRLMVGKQPMYALAISLDPSLVDTNVHPHKEEVRFSEERDITQLVQSAVREALDETLLAPTPETRYELQTTTPADHSDFTQQKIETQVQPLHLDWHSATDTPSYPAGQGVRTTHAADDGHNTERTTWRASSVAERPSRKDPVTMETSAVYGQPNLNGASQNRTTTDVVDEFATAAVSRKENWNLRPVGQALGMYVIADDGDSLYIIDQHAAHERILFESFSNRLNAREVQPMPLLAPLTVTLTPTVFERATEHQARLEELGLAFEPFGGYDVIVRTVPDIWEGLDTDKLALETLEKLPPAGHHHDFYQVMHDVVATRACKAAVKANWYLSEEELQALCHSLTRVKDPFHCPHGRPIFLRWSDKQLEKEFRRIV